MPDFTKETRANLQFVRDTIAGLEENRFNMTYWGYPESMRHGCGSAGCIGGWAEAILFDKNSEADEYDVGAKIGLNENESDNLFYMLGSGVTDFSIDEVTQAHAVKHLDHLLAGGDVDWNLIVLGKSLPKPVQEEEQ